MTDSAVIRMFSKVYASIMKNIYDSLSYRIFSRMSVFMKNSITNSAAGRFFIKPERENASEGFVTKHFSRTAGKAGSLFSPVKTFIAHTMRGSRIIRELFDFYSNILFIPMRTFGVMSLTAGIVYISLTGLVNEIGTSNIAVSAVICAAGGIMMLFRESLYYILEDSLLVRFAAGRTSILDQLGLQDKRANKNHYVLAIILGTIIAMMPVFLPALYAAAGVAALFAVPLILVWPVLGLFSLVALVAFVPTMAAAGLIILTWVSVLLNCSLERMTLRGTIEKGRPVLLFILIIFSGGVLSFALSDSIRIAIIYSVFISTVYLFLSMIKERTVFVATMIFSGAAAFLTAVYGLYQYLTGNIQAGWVDSEMFEGIVRIYSTFENPNVYGEYLLFMIPVVLMLFFTSRRFIYRMFWMGAGLAMFAAMLLTMSRGCWIGLAAGVFIYFLIADRRFLWLFLGAVIVLPFVLPESIMFRLLSIGNLEDSSSLYRLFIWLGTFRMLSDYWLTGVGLGTKAFSGIYSAYAYNGILAPHPHNLYLNVISETGIAGFLCLGWITLKSLRYSISNALKPDSTVKHAGAAIAAAFTGILIQGIFDNVFYNYRMVLIFWIFTALAFVYQQINHKEQCEQNG